MDGQKTSHNREQFDQAEAKLGHTEGQKGSVELSTDAGVEPDAVVIESEAAFVAGIAVLGRAVDVHIAERAVHWPGERVGPVEERLLVELHAGTISERDSGRHSHYRHHEAE